MLFYPRTGIPSRGDGQVRLLDLETGQSQSFTLPAKNMPVAHPVSTAAWSVDSQFYAGGWFAIVFEDEQPPTLVTEYRQTKQGRVLDDDRVVFEDAAHCSDCYGGKYDDKIADYDTIVPIIGEEYAKRSFGTYYENIVAPDGKTAFYQRGWNTSKVEVYVRNPDEPIDRRLSTHRGSCATISQMRLSPDRRLLAYQLGTGCGFVRPPRLYIVEIETRKRWYIGSRIYNTMHWTSDSSRLYFVATDEMQQPQVHYVDIP